MLAAQLIERKWRLSGGEQERRRDDADSILAKVTVTASGWRVYTSHNEQIAASACTCACMFGRFDHRVCDDTDQLIAEGAARDQAVSRPNKQDPAGSAIGLACLLCWCLNLALRWG